MNTTIDTGKNTTTTTITVKNQKFCRKMREESVKAI